MDIPSVSELNKRRNQRVEKIKQEKKNYSKSIAKKIDRKKEKIQKTVIRLLETHINEDYITIDLNIYATKKFHPSNYWLEMDWFKEFENKGYYILATESTFRSYQESIKIGNFWEKRLIKTCQINIFTSHRKFLDKMIDWHISKPTYFTKKIHAGKIKCHECLECNTNSKIFYGFLKCEHLVLCKSCINQLTRDSECPSCKTKCKTNKFILEKDINDSFSTIIPHPLFGNIMMSSESSSDSSESSSDSSKPSNHSSKRILERLFK